MLNTRLDMIRIVLDEDVPNVRCDRAPTCDSSAYVGNAIGREILHERSRENVNADLARVAGLRDSKR